jgi:tRNA (guanine37-N1)-methyltransferase
MKPEPIFKAVEFCLESAPRSEGERKTRILLLEPQGRLYTQSLAQELSEQEHLILICGHYEGVDARVRAYLATDVISIGDYVLTGGELPALILIDSVVRLLPGAIHSPESLGQDSYADGLLGYPQYTRPEEFRGMRVPSVLLSGNHGAIARWRRKEQLRLTRALRPDLFARACLSKEDLQLLSELRTHDEENDFRL